MILTNFFGYYNYYSHLCISEIIKYVGHTRRARLTLKKTGLFLCLYKKICRSLLINKHIRLSFPYQYVSSTE